MYRGTDEASEFNLGQIYFVYSDSAITSEYRRFAFGYVVLNGWFFFYI